MTQHSMALGIKNITEGKNIKKCLDNNEFKEILDACSWSNFQIDWRLFKYFKKIFGRSFFNKIQIKYYFNYIF